MDEDLPAKYIGTLGTVRLAVGAGCSAVVAGWLAVDAGGLAVGVACSAGGVACSAGGVVSTSDALRSDNCSCSVISCLCSSDDERRELMSVNCARWLFLTVGLVMSDLAGYL